MQVLEGRTGDLQRQLLIAQSELKAAREDAHIHELDKSQLQAQLTGELTQLHCLCMRFVGKCTMSFCSEHFILAEPGRTLPYAQPSFVIDLPTTWQQLGKLVLDK